MSGSSKFARGGGRGFNRMTPLSGRGMVPLGRGGNLLKEKGKKEDMGIKGRGLAQSYGLGSGGASAGTFQQEKFELVSCKEQDTLPKFALAIRLTPGLLETMRKAEELGEATSIKFGPPASNNVIRIGGEEFTFTAALEPGHLCDVYEEEKRGQDGNGRLVESGAVWRKLAVTRTLNEKDKNRVKQRSEEAERQQKSRQVLIVDPSNLTNKPTTAADANGRRAPIIKPKNQPPKKKAKTTGPPPVIPPPSAARPRQGLGVAEKPPVPLGATKASARATVASSPDVFASSKPLPSGHGASMASSHLKGAAAFEETGVAAASKGVAVSQKDKFPSAAVAAGVEAGSASKASGGVNTIQLRNCLITLLTDNPKGMTIKAVEKAVGEALSSVRPDKKQIEKVIKSIASYHAPGKYMLKDGVEKGTFTKPSPGSGSSLDSPPLAESTARIDGFQEAQETVGNADSPADAIVAPRQDAKKVDGPRGSALSARRSSGDAVSRAIEKVGEIVRRNADRSRPFGQDQASAPETHKLDDFKDSADPQDNADADNVSIGGDESPLSVLPEKSPEEVALHTDNPDVQAQNVFVSREGNASDASDTSSGSGSTSSSGSDSESESVSATGSESDTDASSSSGSEEENVEEDVNIISDDEEKAGAGAEETDVSRQKPRSKDNRSSLERPDSKAQRQAPPPEDNNEWLRTSKDVDAMLGAHGSGEAEAEAGAVGGDMDDDDEGVLREMKVAHSDEEDVDVVSCDDTTSQQDVVNGSTRPRRRIEDSVTDLAYSGGDKDSLHASISRKAGSESDHSIEEHERRAENSGFRAQGGKAHGEQQGEVHGAQKERLDRMSSPRSKASSGTNVMETVPGSLRQQRETASLRKTAKGTVDGLPSGASKAPPLPDGASVKTGSGADRSQIGILSMPKSAASEMPSGRPSGEAPHKGKPAAELKRKDAKSTSRWRKNTEAEDSQDKGAAGSRIAQPPNKAGEAQGRGPKSKGSADVETPLKSKDGVFSSREEPGLIGKGPETRESMTVDQIVKSRAEGDAVERKNLQRKQNREASTLGKPLEAVARPKEGEKNALPPGQYKGTDVSGKGGRNGKQGRRPGPKKNDLSERWAGLPEVSLNSIDVDMPTRRSFGDGGDFQRSSPRALEEQPPSRNSNGNGAFKSKQQRDSLRPDSDRPDAMSFNSSVASLRAKSAGVSDDLEQGELRDMVAGADLKVRDPARTDQLKDSSDLSKPPSNRSRSSPEKDRPRNGGKLGDVKKRSPAEVKKQQQSRNNTPQKLEVPISLREVMPAVTVQRTGGGSDDRLEGSGSQAVDTGSKTRASLGDHQEKGPEGSRSQKRQADDGVEYGLGRVPKRAAVDSYQNSSLARGGEGESASHKQERLSSGSESNRRNSSADASLRGTPGDGGSQAPPTSSGKGVAENGRFTAQKAKSHDAPETDSADRRPPPLDGKQRAGQPGPGSKKETAPCNGQNKSLPTGNGDEFFALYEKRAPELKGPISCYSQYLEYHNEYLAKYDAYVNLNDVLDRDKNDFLNFKKDITNAKAREDKNQLGKIYGDLRTSYLLCRKRFKRMQTTFEVLHCELSDIKQRCKEYAEKCKSR